ncbi:MAG: hypothetical protein AB8G17_13595 [Gammaproteobacteria bacterium]
MIETESLNAVIGLLYFAAIPLTVVLSSIIRKRYRRRIVASMMTTTAAPEGAFATAAATFPNGHDLQFETIRSGQRVPLRLKLGLRYLASGFAYALSLTVILFVLNEFEFLPIRTSVVVLSFTTPAVLLAMLVAGFRWYWVLLAFIGWTWVLYGIAPESNDIIGMLAMPSAFVALLLANPRMRTTTVPLYLGAIAFLIPMLFVLDVLYGVLLYMPTLPLIESLSPSLALGVFGVLSVALVVAAGVGFALIVLRLVGHLAAGSSELMMQHDALWMFQTLWMIALGWGTIGPPVLLYLLAFLAYRLVLFALRGAAASQPELLLLLRVFGKRSSQQSLARSHLLNWREKGPVMLIGADDLATETLDASELAAFLQRKIGTLFINTPADLEASVANAAARLGDGLYPMQDYYCRDNSWRPTIMSLMARAGRVLLDLRGFSADNLGVQFEIGQLAQRVPADRITVLYDTTTDVALAQQLFNEAWQESAGSSESQTDCIRFQVVE